jgi:hypothetical protein
MAEEKGRKLYKSNQHYRNVATVMEHPEFRNFYDTYMTDWCTAKTIVMFMKVYEALEENSSVELTPYQKLSILHEVMIDSEIRKKAVECMGEWTASSDGMITADYPSSDTIRKCICSSIGSK